MAWFAMLTAIPGGAAPPLQGAAAYELNKRLGQPVWAGAVVRALA